MFSRYCTYNVRNDGNGTAKRNDWKEPSNQEELRFYLKSDVVYGKISKALF